MPSFIKTYYRKIRYLTIGRPYVAGESTKAKDCREKEGFFDKYCKGHGLDIGFGGDPVTPNCRGWDWEHGDAQYLRDIDDNSFDFVYSSHTLEHMISPLNCIEELVASLKAWRFPYIICSSQRTL